MRLKNIITTATTLQNMLQATPKVRVTKFIEEFDRSVSESLPLLDLVRLIGTEKRKKS